MNCRAKFTVSDIQIFKRKAINWLKKFDVSCVLDSNTDIYTSHSMAFHNFDFVIAAGVYEDITSNQGESLNTLDANINKSSKWYFGYLSYELKNYFENLESKNKSNIDWPLFYFFSPKILIFITGNSIEIKTYSNSAANSHNIWEEINLVPGIPDYKVKANLKSRMLKDEYIEKVEKLRKHILKGDIYEVNFCQEFYTKTNLEPYSAYYRLNTISPTPFSSFFRLKNKFLLSASPERFLKRCKNKIISQPIKGTSRRGITNEEDKIMIDNLLKSEKEKAENIMIVDLVRNDLSRIAKKDTVKVEELCGIYSFKQVHQLISTVSAITENCSFIEILRATFPMGSMTGAPKIKAMQLADDYETSKRGIYSGAVGYITPDKDFDFNVVIRSLQYNSENHYLSVMVGGAITYMSDAEKEYEECLIKASALQQLLNTRVE